jgi:hypothetical protein
LPVLKICYTKKKQVGNLSDGICKSVIEHAGKAFTWLNREIEKRLTWENKTDDGSIHDGADKYTWYDHNPDTNGGYAGTPGNGTDTEDFITAPE